MKNHTNRDIIEEVIILRDKMKGRIINEPKLRCNLMLIILIRECLRNVGQ